ncbi:hypothetical protein [Hymenobacter sp. 102]|uniref:hypothetical protein n=1 Tax=Hymenobacter sp. 102 TaxID=3403152 RepID=UPI003CF40DE6
MQPLFENEHCIIYYDESVPAIHQQWQGFASGELLREAHDATVQQVRIHKTPCILADTRQMRVISRADQQWITDSYFPRLIAAGSRRIAIVQSEDIFNQTSVQHIMTDIVRNSLVVAEHFQTMEAARAWLRENC